MVDQPPAGWYPDPNDPTAARYWDGVAWTGATGPPLEESEAPWSRPAPPGLEGADRAGWSTGKILAVVALVTLAVAAVLFGTCIVLINRSVG